MFIILIFPLFSVTNSSSLFIKDDPQGSSRSAIFLKLKSFEKLFELIKVKKNYI
jgi:hypothetical protein